jgi:hypothetical protein
MFTHIDVARRPRCAINHLTGDPSSRASLAAGGPPPHTVWLPAGVPPLPVVCGGLKPDGDCGSALPVMLSMPCRDTVGRNSINITEVNSTDGHLRVMSSVRSLPPLTSRTQAGARGADNGSRSRYRGNGAWKGMRAHVVQPPNRSRPVVPRPITTSGSAAQGAPLPRESHDDDRTCRTDCRSAARTRLAEEVLSRVDQERHARCRGGDIPDPLLEAMVRTLMRLDAEQRQLSLFRTGA